MKFNLLNWINYLVNVLERAAKWISSKVAGFIQQQELTQTRKTILLNELTESASPGVDYFVLIILSCTIATFGLINNSSDTIIGKGTKLDNHVHVGHDTVIGKNCLFAAHVGIAGCVNIEDEVIFWGQVGCQKDLTVGKGAIVYGQSGISKSLKGGLVYFGSPAKEAREKMKEMALVSRLPELFSKIK